jgi:hypothetical protein
MVAIRSTGAGLCARDNMIAYGPDTSGIPVVHQAQPLKKHPCSRGGNHISDIDQPVTWAKKADYHAHDLIKAGSEHTTPLRSTLRNGCTGNSCPYESDWFWIAVKEFQVLLGASEVLSGAWLTHPSLTNHRGRQTYDRDVV